MGWGVANQRLWRRQLRAAKPICHLTEIAVADEWADFVVPVMEHIVADIRSSKFEPARGGGAGHLERCR